KVKIIEGKTVKLYSDFLIKSTKPTLWKDYVQVQIANHYAPEAGVRGKVKSTTSMQHTLTGSIYSNSPANTSNGVVNINLTFKDRQILDDKGNIINFLKHEKIHQDKGDVKSFIDHSKVYLEQLKDNSFTSNTTSEYRIGTVASFANHLLNANVEGEDGVDDLIADFNKNNKAGLYLVPSPTNDPKLTTITIYEGQKAMGIVSYDKLSSPSK
ncbi:MAG: hypothetical protein EOO43_05000, partial [Flavobacterium sp.]